MEQKQLKQFTFYDLYWDLIRQSDDASAGRLARNICRYMFTDELINEPQDDRENFFWSNIVDLLEEDKQIELCGKQPKNLNAKMRHFTFVDTYYKAIKLMSEAESGQYVKAICEYMFNGTERKLKSPVDAYFALAKRKLELSRTRKKIGSVGGKQERIKVTDEQVEAVTKTACGVSFDEFMSMHPNVENDLYASRQYHRLGVVGHRYGQAPRMEEVQQLVSTVSPLQGNSERCVDGAKAEANRELITREYAPQAALRSGMPIFARLRRKEILITGGTKI